MYGSSFWIETRNPRSLSSRPRAAAVTPLPTELTTPPVRKTYLVIGVPLLPILPIKGGGEGRLLAPSPPWTFRRARNSGHHSTHCARSAVARRASKKTSPSLACSRARTVSTASLPTARSRTYPLSPWTYTCSSIPRPSSWAIRSPRLSIAADIAETRSSSTPAGSDDAMINPSTLTTAEASTSGVLAWRSLRRWTIWSVRDLVMRCPGRSPGETGGSLPYPPTPGKQAGCAGPSREAFCRMQPTSPACAAGLRLRVVPTSIGRSSDGLTGRGDKRERVSATGRAPGLPANAFQQRAHDVGNDRGHSPHEQHLQAAAEQIPFRDEDLRRPEAKEGQGRQTDGNREGNGGRDREDKTGQVDQEGNRSRRHEGQEGGQRAPERALLVWKEPQFVDHHGVHPAFFRLRLDFHQTRGVFIAIAAGPIDLQELGLFSFGEVVHFPGLTLPFALVVLRLTLRREVGACGHREAVGEEVCQAENQDDVAAKLGAGNAAHDGKGRDDAVEAAVDQVANILMARLPVFLRRGLNDPPARMGLGGGLSIPVAVGIPRLIHSSHQAHGSTFPPGYLPSGARPVAAGNPTASVPGPAWVVMPGSAGQIGTAENPRAMISPQSAEGHSCWGSRGPALFSSAFLQCARQIESWSAVHTSGPDYKPRVDNNRAPM